ncbi:hypothetical protein MAPG_03060 [Magnaporthiopsis poae ATCC 64411]|uniref:Uncharacterized protein n=1 Tax=Magnaporthiopsis poae (strain ATCC 64411 / 73-15) TaxID=644358 RepID=A0A0C4DT11_MAGP6|nr:hypothetical protein MAPG_03060 [Magnaporthiopsis poae ATCC 64411]
MKNSRRGQPPGRRRSCQSAPLRAGMELPSLWKLQQAVESCVEAQVLACERTATANHGRQKGAHSMGAPLVHGRTVHLGGATLLTTPGQSQGAVGPSGALMEGTATDGLHARRQASALKNASWKRGATGLEPSNQEHRPRNPCLVPQKADADQSALEKRRWRWRPATAWEGSKHPISVAVTNFNRHIPPSTVGIPVGRSLALQPTARLRPGLTVLPNAACIDASNRPPPRSSPHPPADSWLIQRGWATYDSGTGALGHRGFANMDPSLLPNCDPRTTGPH